jgi:hypothetical protein
LKTHKNIARSLIEPISEADLNPELEQSKALGRIPPPQVAQAFLPVQDPSTAQSLETNPIAPEFLPVEDSHDR